MSTLSLPVLIPTLAWLAWTGPAMALSDPPGQDAAAAPVRAFVEAPGFRLLKPAAIAALYARAESRHAPLASLGLDAMSHALFLVERQPVQPGWVRYQIRHAGRDPVSGDERIEVTRYNLGPAMRAQLAREYGHEHGGLEAGDRLPHQRWRFMLRDGSIRQAARRNLAPAEAQAARCLGALPCLGLDQAPQAATLQRGRWQEDWHPPARLAGLRLPPAHPAPAAGDPFMPGAAQLAYDALRVAGAAAAPEGETPASQTSVEVLVDVQVHGQDDNAQATACLFGLADERLADRCVRTLAVPGLQAWAHYLACRRGTPVLDAGQLHCP